MMQTCRLKEGKWREGCQRLADRQAQRQRGEHADRQPDLVVDKRTDRLTKRRAN